MTNHAPPSGNLADSDTLQGVLKFAFTKFLQKTDDMLPAQVLAYDRATNRASVQPLIRFVTTKNEVVSRSQIASVPVLQLGGGGFVLSFPIKAGDLGWIKANDRDISFFKKNYTNSSPNTQRKHSFEDAMFIPDSMMKQVVIDPEDAENVVLQNLAGTVRIALWADKVKITAPEIVLDTPLTTITGALISGTNPEYGQTAEFNGTISTTQDVTAKGGGSVAVSLHNHTHGGVQTGGGDTGVPNT